MRTVVEEGSRNIAIMDVFSKLIQERIIFIGEPIDDNLANEVVAQMLYLDSIERKPIKIYINSPGGSVHAGLAIYDIGKIIKSTIKTFCVGMAASMGAILMLMGEERSCLEHSRLMLHQPSGGAIGSTEDIVITAEEIVKTKEDLYKIIEEKTTLENVNKELLFDKWFNAQEALDCGLITKIL